MQFGDTADYKSALRRIEFMKLQNGLMILTVAALELAGWCAFEVHALQGRIDWMSGALRAAEERSHGRRAGRQCRGAFEKRSGRAGAGRNHVRPAGPRRQTLLRRQGPQLAAGRIRSGRDGRGAGSCSGDPPAGEQRSAGRGDRRVQEFSVGRAQTDRGPAERCRVRQGLRRRGAGLQRVSSGDDPSVHSNFPPTQPPVSNQRWDSAPPVH